MATYPVKLLIDKDGTAFIPVVNSDSIITSDGDTLNDLLDEKQDTLVSGTSIKTVNNQSLLGSGDITISGGGGDSLPVGAIVPFSGPTIPTNYLEADGSAVSRTTYSELFDVIGTTYGTGDGSTTFNLPNLKGKVPVGLDSSDTSFDTLGETGGEKTHTLTTTEIPSHTHGVTWQENCPPWLQAGGYGQITASGSSGANRANIGNLSINAAGGGGAHNNLQPYITQKYIIKAKPGSGGGGGGGSSTDVQINGTSITNNDIANIVTNMAYNSSSNKIATMDDTLSPSKGIYSTTETYDLGDTVIYNNKLYECWRPKPNYISGEWNANNWMEISEATLLAPIREHPDQETGYAIDITCTPNGKYLLNPQTSSFGNIQIYYILENNYTTLTMNGSLFGPMVLEISRVSGDVDIGKGSFAGSYTLVHATITPICYTDERQGLQNTNPILHFVAGLDENYSPVYGIRWVEQYVKNIQINGTSISSTGAANIITEGTYDASTNKIVTKSYVDDIVGDIESLLGGI